MRLKLKFSSDENITLPHSYNYALQGMIYNIFSKNLASFLHDKGFLYEKRGFKLFTFSKLTAKRFDIENKNITFTPPLYLQIASAKDDITKDIGSNILKSSSVRLKDYELKIESIEVVETVDFKEENIIKTLSPISVYKTPKSKKIYLIPDDFEFKKLLKDNIKKKYELITDEKLNDFLFDIEPIGKYKKSFIRYQGGLKMGVEGKFYIKCEPKIFEKVYDAGLGANNAAGFGMVEVV